MTDYNDIRNILQAEYGELCSSTGHAYATNAIARAESWLATGILNSNSGLVFNVEDPTQSKIIELMAIYFMFSGRNKGNDKGAYTRYNLAKDMVVGLLGEDPYNKKPAEQKNIARGVVYKRNIKGWGDYNAD